MTIRRILSRPLVGIALVGIAATAGVAQSQTLDFGSCVRIEDLSARLACYDRAAGRAPAAAAPAAPAPAPAPQAAPRAAAAPAAPAPAPAATPRMPADPVASFGAESVPTRQNDALTAEKIEKRQEQAALPKEIEARVTSVQRRPRGEQVLTLDNGQVWEQTEVRSEPRYATGDTIVIRRGLLGSFLLTLQKGSPTSRVKRIS